MLKNLFPPTVAARHFAEERRLTVWFDGACPICAREVAFFDWLDRQGAVHFEDISQSGSDCSLDRARMLARFHAQEKGKPIVPGAAAFAAMWRAIPILRPFGELARIPALLRVLERVYMGFLKVRPRFQRLFR